MASLVSSLQCFAPALVIGQKNRHSKRECTNLECDGPCTACYTQYLINKDGSKMHAYGCWGPNSKPLSSLVFNETGGCHSFNASESNEWVKVGKDVMKFIVQEANNLMKPHMECLAKEVEKIEKYEKVCSCETSGCNSKMESDDTFPQECMKLLPANTMANTAEKRLSPFFISIVATILVIAGHTYTLDKFLI